jgi:hypothetical protein
MIKNTILCQADYSQRNLAILWKISRSEIRKLEIDYKIVCFLKMLSIVNATSEVEMDGVGKATCYL